MSASTGTNVEFGRCMGDVAHELLGEPNRALSSRNELRYGQRGSLSIDLKKGTFFDHEIGQGGGVVRFVETYVGTDRDGAIHWLKDRKYMMPQTEKATKAAGAKPKIVARYTYLDEGGTPLFQVWRM